MASLLDIGVSGLRVNQTALQVTGNNIANADVESYSRQRAEVVTGIEQFRGTGYIGSGSNVQTITRVADEFLNTQIRLDTSSYTNLTAFGDNIEQIDSLLAGELSSLGPGIAAVFSAIEVGAEDPTSNPARQLVLSQAEGLVERVHTLYDRLLQQSKSVDEQVASLTARVNSLATGIAELNVSIERELGINTGSKPNGLIDSRDELIRELTGILSIRTTKDSDGAVNVFVGSGQPLVLGAIAGKLGVQASVQDAEVQDVAFIGVNGIPIVITESVSGGEIGGLLQFRHDAMEPTLNAMGRIALAITDSINQQNKQGLDLEGNVGSLVFTDINNAQKMSERSKTIVGTANLDVIVDDLSKLGVDNYMLTITATGPPEQGNLVNESTGEIIPGTFVATDHDSNALTPDVNLFTPTDLLKTEGLSIYVNSGVLAQNDSFFIRPTRNGARDVDMQMTRLQELAFAAPIVTDAALTNTGGGTVSAGNILQARDRYDNSSPAFATPGQLTPPISINFTSPSTYEVYDSSTGPATLLFTGTFTQGQKNPVFSTDPTVLPPVVPPAAAPFYLGYQVELGGNPATGDIFTVGFNSGGISDNRNAVELGQLRINGILQGGSLNFEADYGRLVEELGSDTSQNRVSREASFSLLQASTNNRSSISGVNLDEEAANLIRFEQAYNASAQVISIARQIFDTMLRTFS
ncbi:MAG: flagellar hook-associated protein 1 FlgK [Oceanicoccus sp.]|jgi:flagellar hook-associated protein 1 FlgK